MLTLFLPDGHGGFIGNMFLFCLFPKLLGIQITCSSYLKVSPDLHQYNWNTFETIRNIPEGDSATNMLLLAIQNVKSNFQFIFFKDGFPAVYDDYISFSVLFEAFGHLNDMFKVSKSISRLTPI